MITDIAVIGLGKLGATMTACLASRGFNVIGVDVSQKAVNAMNAGQAPAQETGLDELIAKHKDRIRATLSHEDAILKSDLSFVIVPTPSDERGAFSLQYAAYAFEGIGKALAKREGYHTIVLTSTVLPGSTRYGYCRFWKSTRGSDAEKISGCVTVRSLSLLEPSSGTI